MDYVFSCVLKMACLKTESALVKFLAIGPYEQADKGRSRGFSFTFGKFFGETPGAASASPGPLAAPPALCLPGNSEAVLSDFFNGFVYVPGWP